MSVEKQPCPECGHQNPLTLFQCENCHADLKHHDEGGKTITKPIDEDPDAGETRHIDDLFSADEELNTGRALMQGDLVLTVQQGGKQYRIANTDLQEVVLGRRNRDTGFIPTVDLTDAEGQKYGVSRRHATLARQHNHLVLIDHSSGNGTYLNGKRLMPEQARVVRDADLIKLGQLEIIVSFQKK